MSKDFGDNIIDLVKASIAMVQANNLVANMYLRFHDGEEISEEELHDVWAKHVDANNELVRVLTEGAKLDD